jgi:hypothetical protein
MREVTAFEVNCYWSFVICHWYLGIERLPPTQRTKDQ